MSGQEQKPAADEPQEALPPDPRDPDTSTMLGRAHSCFEYAHDKAHRTIERAASKYPDDHELRDNLDDIHSALENGHEHLHDHIDAAASAKHVAQMMLGMTASLFIGQVLGHLQTLPQEPHAPVGPRFAAYFSGLKPETKTTLMGLIEQGAALAAAWVQGQRAGAVPREDAPPATPADAAPPEPVVTPPPAS